MDEKDLTEKQRRWLEASRKIGPGPMTKTERKSLEELYAEMLPLEQQELLRYIQENFGEKKSEEAKEEDLIEKMASKVWRSPSDALRTAFAKTQKLKLPKI